MESNNYFYDVFAAFTERTIRRLWIIIILLIIALVGSNLTWILYVHQFETVETTITQDVDSGDGGDAIINDGVHINGESETNDNCKTKTT